ncbi:MAG: hypothetical protein BWX97_01808 [Firmicutes bacterium ADurb.Bin146]|nr:MAG: hypothetical protein BWX97_01808 [Firmicutes bacterium ADurb.Bin146]
MLFNIYCDETCHLEKDNINVMVIGAVWCPQEKLIEINQRIKQIKERNDIYTTTELKWTKMRPAKIDIYKDIVNYFFDDDLHLRAVIIPDKTKLNHKAFNQTHDMWYYKMYFDILKVIFPPDDRYEIYIDIKDTNSHKSVQKLKDVCCNSMYDFSGKIIDRFQPIRSEEVQIMQLVDILIGAIAYENRVFAKDFKRNKVKEQMAKLVRERSNYTLTKTTLYRESKFNLLV